MAEQIPEAWIGQEVTVYFGLEGYRQPGILKAVSERGIVSSGTPTPLYSGSCKAGRGERKYAHTERLVRIPQPRGCRLTVTTGAGRGKIPANDRWEKRA
jgi:hypothetical protein